MEPRIKVTPGACRTATPMANGDIWRHSAALSEFGSLFLNALQRSVNRKVRSSNLRPGANFRIEPRRVSLSIAEWLTATVRQFGGNADSFRGSRSVDMNSNTSADACPGLPHAVQNRKVALAGRSLRARPLYVWHACAAIAPDKVRPSKSSKDTDELGGEKNRPPGWISRRCTMLPKT